MPKQAELKEKIVPGSETHAPSRPGMKKAQEYNTKEKCLIFIEKNEFRRLLWTLSDYVCVLLSQVKRLPKNSVKTTHIS